MIINNITNKSSNSCLLIVLYYIRRTIQRNYEIQGISIVDAIKKLYSSEMYKKLENESSKTWHLGPVALYEDFMEENYIL